MADSKDDVQRYPADDESCYRRENQGEEYLQDAVAVEAHEADGDDDGADDAADERMRG